MGGRFSSSSNKSANGDDSAVAEDTMVVKQHKNNNSTMSHRCRVLRLPILEILSFSERTFEMSVPLGSTNRTLTAPGLSIFFPGSLEVRQK
jgi:hypothetical protein